MRPKIFQKISMSDPKLKPSQLEDELWQTATSAASPFSLQGDSGAALMGFIKKGVTRMVDEQRLDPVDLALAHANLGRFIGLLKGIAEIGENTNQLDAALLRSAESLLLAGRFHLWPFWTNPVHGIGAVVEGELQSNEF